VTLTPDKIVDVLRALQTGNGLTFATVEELDRFGGPVAFSQSRYAELKREMSFREAGSVAQAEMIATILGVPLDGIREEVLRRYALESLSLERDLAEQKRDQES
jgi:hypothetical protein